MSNTDPTKIPGVNWCAHTLMIPCQLLIYSIKLLRHRAPRMVLLSQCHIYQSNYQRSAPQNVLYGLDCNDWIGVELDSRIHTRSPWTNSTIMFCEPMLQSSESCLVAASGPPFFTISLITDWPSKFKMVQEKNIYSTDTSYKVMVTVRI